MSTLNVAVTGTIATVTIENPARRNALTNETVRGLRRSLHELDEDTGVAAVILTGVDGSFCAGADLTELRNAPPPDADAWIQQVSDRVSMLRTWTAMRAPTIAAVDGPAIGIGFLLAIQSNLVIASEQAVFGMPEARLGFADPGTTRHLRHWLSPQRVAELMFTGRSLGSHEAQAWGLINEVSANPLIRAQQLAQELISIPAAARSSIKNAIGAQFLDSDPATVGLSGALSHLGENEG